MRRAGIVLVTTLLAAGCGSTPAATASAPVAPSASGIASPATGAPSTAASPSTEASTTVSSSPNAPFTLTSQAFAAGAAIPRKYSCDGQGVSPPLAWTGVPSGTAELALLVDDPDARGFVHWVAAGIDPGAAGIPEGATGSDAVPVEGRNGAGRNGWTGPCPPSGTHHYRFTLYAVSRPLGLKDGATADELRNAVKDATTAKAELVATYSRG